MLATIPVTAAQAPADAVNATKRLIRAAQVRQNHAALVGGPTDRTYSYGELARTVLAAAGGLVSRGLEPADVVGVYASDAVSYVIAVHAIAAAGGIPSPVSPGLTVPEIAGQLADCGSRMLLTAPQLAGAAVAAADRSWVRQVISFGRAAGTIKFSALLGNGTLQPRCASAQETALLAYTRRPDGTLAAAPVTHRELADQLRRLQNEAGLGEQDVVLTAPPAGDGRSYTAHVDHALIGGATIVAATPSELAGHTGGRRFTAAIVPGGMLVGAGESLRILPAD
jgi:acyl-CoA synthetase (AMP-forming)/AMP-acid ligase II